MFYVMKNVPLRYLWYEMHKETLFVGKFCNFVVCTLISNEMSHFRLKSVPPSSSQIQIQSCGDTK